MLLCFDDTAVFGCGTGGRVKARARCQLGQSRERPGKHVYLKELCS